MTPSTAQAHFKLIHQFLDQNLETQGWQSLQKHLSSLGFVEPAWLVRQIKKLKNEDRLSILDLFSEFQVHSKLWCIEELAAVLPQWPKRIIVLGGWSGGWVLNLRWVRSENCEIISVDQDAQACRIGHHLSEPYIFEGIRFETQDIETFVTNTQIDKSDLIICSILEHLPDPSGWLRLLPTNTLVALQGSSDNRPDDHISPADSWNEFLRQAPLTTSLYQGHLEWSHATRWMHIGLT